MHKNFLIFLLFVGLTLQYACFDPPEGCRDIRATNYNVTADIDCEDCCKYSNLYIDIEHSMDGISIDTSIYFKHGNDSLRIKNLIYFLSDIKLHDGIDFVSSSSEQKHKIGLLEEGNYKFIQRNFNVAKISIAKNSSYSLGEFLYADLYQGLSLDFGIDPEINHADMSELSSSSPLFNSSDNMYINQDSGYYFLQLEVELNKTVIKNYFISGDESIINFFFDNEIDLQFREEKYLYLGMKLEKLFNEVDFSSENDDLIGKKLKENLQNAIELAF